MAIRFDKFTIKAQEALQRAQSLAADRGNPQIESLHLLAALPDSPRAIEPFPALLEYDMSENALRTELAKDPIRHVGGMVDIPRAPGLGIEIDRAVIERYLSR